MLFPLRCQGCKEISYNLPETLYSTWVESLGENDNKDTNEGELRLFIHLKCRCGHTTEFGDPMFRYAFKVIFEEFSK